MTTRQPLLAAPDIDAYLCDQLDRIVVTEDVVADAAE